MPSWLLSGAGPLGISAAKAALMYLIALLGLRFTHRRTLGQWRAIDFAAVGAVGAIVGRTATASSQTLLVGIVALLTILLAHTVVTFGRYLPGVTRLTDHRVRILVDHGRVRHQQLLLCGLTSEDLYAQLRQQGVHDVSDLRYVLFESMGDLTIVREAPDEEALPALVSRAVSDAAGR
jgi:uncharacterized membrane protein YcaP (DUF421 family)